MKFVLMEYGLWGFPQEGQEVAPQESALATVRAAYRSDKAYSMIALNVEKDLQVHISSGTDPHKAWKILQKQSKFVSITQIVRLNRTFYTDTKEGSGLMKHLHIFHNYVNLLTKKEMVDGMNCDVAHNHNKNMKLVFFETCKINPSQSKACIGQQSHTKLCTVMCVVQCKWNQRVAASTC